MIKRRFYRADRGDNDKDDASSDSSSDSEVEVRSSDESEEDEPTHHEHEPDSNVEVDNDADNDDNEDDDDDDVPSPSKLQHPSSSSSGYESEDSSANEIDAESGGGLLANDDDSGSEKDGDQLKESLLSNKESGELIETQTENQSAVDDLPRCVLKSKSVFKCRLCPKIVCLNEESLKTHLKSKRHSRSEKLLNGGRLRRYLNSDGEEEVISDDDCETHAERHARIIALAQDTSVKKSKGRQRQRHRLKRKKNSSTVPGSGQQKENRAKRRRKNAD